MNQTQFQQEPETTLPRAESPHTSETEDAAMALEAGEALTEQSASVEKLLEALEQNARKRQKLKGNISTVYAIGAIIYLLLMVAGWIFDTILSKEIITVFCL